MADFSFVTVRLATGAAISTPDDVSALAAAGVTAVIDCRAEFDDGPLLAGQFAYLWNGTEDDGTTKDPSWFARSLAFGLPLLAQPHQRVYCHCAAGRNRGPSTAYAVMRALGWGSADAEATIRAARPQVELAYKDDADAAIAVLGYA
jgi:hypothetical protein